MAWFHSKTPPTPPEQPRRSRGDLLARWHAELQPRALLVLGGQKPPPFAGSLITLFVDVDDPPEPARNVKVVQQHPLDFLARQDLQAVAVAHHHRAPPGGFFDLALVDSDRYPDSATLRRILHRLLPLAHGGSLVALGSARDQWLGPVITRFAEAHAGVVSASAGASDGELVIVGDLVGGGRGGRQSDAGNHDAFVRERAERPLPLAAGEPIATEPVASSLVRPRYVELGGARLGVDDVRYNRGLASWWNKPLELLPVGLERYRDVRWFRANGFNRSILVTDDAVLPASFRWRYGYGPAAVTDASTSGATFIYDGDGCRQPPAFINRAPAERIHREPLLLLGHVDTRFGHALLEGLSRAWALPWARARDMRVLAWWDDELRPFQKRLLELLDLPADRVETPVPGTLYRELVVPGDGFRLMSSVSPVVARSWRRIAEAAAAAAPGAASSPRRILLSRRLQDRRRLLNGDEFEQLFADRGFALVCPETLPFDDQIRLVANADLVAGCYGSQLHLSVFMRPGARKLVVAREHFNGPEETLIAQANGVEASYYFEPQARKGYLRSNATPWTIDLARFEGALDRWIDGSDAPRR